VKSEHLSSLSNFQHLFTKIYGKSPSSYVKEFKNKEKLDENRDVNDSKNSKE
jgi:AraC-like DNA-binding protein